MSAVAPLATDRIGCEVEVSSANDAEVQVRGRIVDSWVEPSGTCDWDSRLVLQVAPRGRSRDLVTLEASASLVPDLDWLTDLAENLCHGSPVNVLALPTRSGDLRAIRLTSDR